MKFNNFRQSQLATRAFPRQSSWEQWWRWLWLIAFIGGLTFVARDLETISERPLQLEVIHRPITASIVGLLLLPAITRGPLVMFRGILGVLSLFALLRLVSTLWSPNPLWTLYRSLEYIVIAALTAYTAVTLHTIEELRKWVNWVWLWYGLLMVSAWIGAIVAPEKALLPVPGALLPVQLFGIFPLINANELATIGALLALVGINRWIKSGHTIRWMPLIVISLATMILAQGRSALVGFLFGLLFVLVFHRRTNIPSFLTFLFLLAPLLLEEYFVEFFRRGQSPALISSFTGRKFWWEFAWEHYISKSPWIGYGAFAAQRFLVIHDLVGKKLARGSLSTLHNAWVETAVEIGLLGVLLLFLVVIMTWWALVKRAWHGSDMERTLCAELAGIFAVMAVRSFFASDIVLHNSFAFFVTVGVAFALNRKARMANTVQRFTFEPSHHACPNHP